MFIPPPQRLRVPESTAIKAYDALAKVLSDKSVIKDPEIIAGYSNDESGAGAYMPQIVVRPGNSSHVEETVKIANRFGIPVQARGGGTGRAGGCLALEGGIVISMEKMNRILSIDPLSMTATVQPGVITGNFHQAVEEKGLFYPPDPGSLDSCHIAGNVATNASGPRHPKYGPTRDYVRSMEVVLPEGRRIRTGGHSLKGVSGYDLGSLICGSEGTLGIITELVLRLLPRPKFVETAVLFFPDIRLAAKAVLAIMHGGHRPRALELMDHVAVNSVRGKTSFRFPEGDQTLLILELDGNSKDALFDEMASIGELAEAQLKASLVLVAKNSVERNDLWEARRLMSPSLRESWGLKYAEDIGVPIDRIPDIIDAVHTRAEKEGIDSAIYGHAGDGSFHVNFLFRSPDAWPAVMRAAEGVFKDSVRLGGVITSEHGIGILKREYLHFEQEAFLIDIQKRIKKTLDPLNIMNPGKIFP